MKIKVAVIGCGSIAEYRHAPEYKNNDNVEIVAFCDPVLTRAENLAQKFGGNAFSDYKEILELEEVDAVSICTSNSSHASIAIEFLKAGKHVLCEKPMATCLSDASLMAETAHTCGKVLMIGHNQRFEKAHTKAKQILESGELGRILTFKTYFGHSGPENWSVEKGPGTWFFKKHSAFVGALGDLGVHKSDLIRWLINDEIEEVSAFLSTRDKKGIDNDFIDVEDNAICILKSSSGIIGSMASSWTNYGEMNNSTVIYCEKGIIKIYCHPEHPLVVENLDRDKTYYNFTEKKSNGFHTDSGVINSFINAVINGTQPEISAKEGFEALSIIVACVQACQSKEHIRVEHMQITDCKILKNTHNPIDNMV